MASFLPRVSAQPAGALLYATTFYDPKLIAIDPVTGAGTLVGALPASPRDLVAYNGSLYVYGPSSPSVKLTRIDASTGTVLDTVTFTNAIGGGEGAMDIRPDGYAFGTSVIGNTGTFFRLQPSTTNMVFVTAESGQSPALDGLAFDTNKMLYGISQNRGGDFGLYIVDQLTGATALVGDLGVDFPFNGGAVAGLAFAPNGDLYAALGNPTDSNLYRLDKSTGVATLVGAIGWPGVSGLRFLDPPPGPLSIRNTGAASIVGWPHARGGVLQGAAGVTGPWTNVVATISTNGAEASATFQRNGREGYLRLVR